MGKFDIRRLKEEAERDFEGAWLKSGELIKREGKFFELADKRAEHPLFGLIIKVREILLGLGFTEVVVPTIIEKSEVFKQFGPEAPVILDRVFFLAGLDRPDIGIDAKRIEQIRRVVPNFAKVKELQSIFRRYKRAEISSDDLLETMVKELGVDEAQASSIISIFSELRDLRPIPLDLTLRSHTTAGWFSVLAEMQRRQPLPLQLFSIGPKFRREQRLDPTHLYDSWTASIAIMAEEISLEDGKRIAGEILRRLGFDDFKMEIKTATSKYYAPQTEFEIFLRHPKTGKYLEVGDAGFYSPVSLAKYDIANPVFNLGLGIERILMIKMGEEDIREVIYPYFYKPPTFTDVEISKAIKFERAPRTEVGKEIASAIVRVAERRADEPSPCEFEAFRGELLGKHVKVSLVEPESGTKLVGPAGFNMVYVYDGNIIGVPPKGWERDEFLQKVKASGKSTGIRYIDAFAALAAHEIERAVKENKRRVKVRVPNIKLLSDINLKIDDAIHRYITDQKKRIDVRGPFFTTVVAEISG